MAGSMVAPYDVKLNGNKYLVVPGTYNEGPDPGTVKPYRTTGGDPESRSNEMAAWAFWAQSVWRGEDVEDWREGLGGFYRATGVDISRDGEVGAGAKLVQTLNDATNPDGYLLIPLSSSTVVAIGKTTGRTWTSPDMVTWTQRNFVSGGSRQTNAWAFYQGKLCVSDSNGDIYTTTDGITWTNASVSLGIVKPSSTSCYVLGTYRSRLYIAWGTDLRYYNGASFQLTQLVTLEGTPVCAAVGSGSMFILAQGTPSHLYLAQGDNLVELLQWPSNFTADDAVFTDTLYVSGGSPDTSGGWTGEIWRYINNGIEQVYDMPQLFGTGVDYRIRSLGADDMVLLYSVNKLVGYGEYDSSYDLWLDPVLGFAIPAKTAAVQGSTNKTVGILAWGGLTCVGVTGLGLYTTSGFSDWQLTSSLFGSASKRITKMWGFCEVTHTALVAGQSFTVEYSTDGVNFSTLGTKNYAASYTAPDSSVKTFFTFPANTTSPVMQYRITATCNNADFSLLDISFSFIEAASNPKRHWSFVIALMGTDLEPMQYRDDSDFERSGPTMKTELDGLWNKQFTFEDLFGKSYTVMMPAPHVTVDDVVKTLNAGDQTTVDNVIANYRVNLVEV